MAVLNIFTTQRLQVIYYTSVLYNDIEKFPFLADRPFLAASSEVISFTSRPGSFIYIANEAGKCFINCR